MSWKQWAVMILLALIVVKAPHMVMGLLHQVGASVATFWNALGLH